MSRVLTAAPHGRHPQAARARLEEKLAKEADGVDILAEVMYE